MRHFPRGTAVLTSALLSLGLLAGCSDDDPPVSDDLASSPSSDASDATDGSTAPSPTATETGGTGGTDGVTVGAVPAYYVGDTPQGDRLYREFTSVSGVDKLVAAAAAVTSGDPVDPDYRTLWPGGRFKSVTQQADAIVVEVPDKAWLEAGKLDDAQAELAVQQLVYSLQGAAGKRLPVRVQYDGQPAATLLGVDASQGLKATPELEVLAFVNITEPAEGTVVGNRFLAEGRASSFEGTVIWEIHDKDGKVVLDGWSNAAGWVDQLYPWRKQVNASNLAPGQYTFVARTDDPSDGEGGGPTEDTKRITIK